MSEPDAGRFVAVDPAAAGKIPVPGQARWLQPGERVDAWDAYWAQLLRDGSIVARAPDAGRSPLDPPAVDPSARRPQSREA